MDDVGACDCGLCPPQPHEAGVDGCFRGFGLGGVRIGAVRTRCLSIPSPSEPGRGHIRDIHNSVSPPCPLARLGRVRLGLVRPGIARLGIARLGLARLGLGLGCADVQQLCAAYDVDGHCVDIVEQSTDDVCERAHVFGPGAPDVGGERDGRPEAHDGVQLGREVPNLVEVSPGVDVDGEEGVENGVVPLVDLGVPPSNEPGKPVGSQRDGGDVEHSILEGGCEEAESLHGEDMAKDLAHDPVLDPLADERGG